MKILYCENLKPGNLATWSVHVFEVVTNLTRMGHSVALLNRDPPILENKMDIQQQSWQSVLKNSLLKSRLLRPVAGYLTIIALFVLEFKVFISSFFIIAGQKQRFDVIYRRHNLLSSERLLAKLFRIPSVREVNGIYSDELKSQNRGDRFSLWILDRIERLNMPKADRIVTVTAKLKTVLHEDYGVPENNIFVVPNGANIDLFKPGDALQARKELGLNAENGYVCFVGHLVKWMNIESLIESAPSVLKELTDTKFLIVGDGASKEGLTNLAKSLGVADNFTFTGMVPYDKVPLYINAADVCMMTAIQDYRNSRMGTSPLKLHEYMACGKPVIATRFEGDVEEIAESGCGLVMESTSAGEIAAAIITLLKNEEMRKEMGERARKLVVEKYSWNKNVEHIAEVCQSVVNQRLLTGKPAR